VGERTSYPPGTFSWTDLGTTDAVSATRFYTELFGWEAEETPAGEGTYAMLRLSGRAVAGLYGRDASVAPPAWLSYVTVADADDVAARAEQAGATVVEPPFDVADAGRTAVLRDPTGASFALWQPGVHVGAAVVNDPGAMCLNQLNTSDPAVAERFYTDVFGWRIDFAGNDEQAYWGLFNDGRLNGGMMPLPAGSPAPSHWLVYFTSADLDASAAEAERLGGRVLVPPTAIPSGRIAVLADPQGAVFALFEGRVDP
jgi:predicted enzyme related to lactoylglutathione lyase